MNNVSYGLIKEYKLYLKQANWKQHQQNKTTKKALAVGFQVSKREIFDQEGLVGFLRITSAHHTH